MRFLFQQLFAMCARIILSKYRPQIVAITGSVGKTSVKDAVACVLSGHFSVRKTPLNFNTDFGVPMTIIGGRVRPKSSPPFRMIVAAFAFFFRTLRLILVRDSRYPRILVLEFGADKPGDIEYLVRLVPPHIAILTAIEPAHLEGFKTIDAVIREKKSIYSRLSKRDWYVGDASRTITLPDQQCPARPLLFATEAVFEFAEADVQISNVVERLVRTEDTRNIGVSFHVRYQGQSAVIELNDVIGEHFVSTAAYAIGAGLVFGIPLEAIGHALLQYRSPRGRMRPIDGTNGSLIIDDTYNASPSAMKLALDVLTRFELLPSARRWAILGDMFELGEQSEALHTEVGAYAGALQPDFLVCVGPKAQRIADSAAASGLDGSRIVRFDDPVAAGRAVKQKLLKGDIVLVKGSQGIRLEKCVKELMADPTRAADLLVRQDWTP